MTSVDNRSAAGEAMPAPVCAAGLALTKNNNCSHEVIKMNSAVVSGDVTPQREIVRNPTRLLSTAKVAPSPTVSLVIPAKNEARNIAWVLEQVPDSVTEIILVDGDSSDATLTTALRYRPDIKVVRQDGPGKGNALRSGFMAATGDIIVMIDADGSMSPAEISHYVHFLNNGYDFVKGSRAISGGGSLDITRFRRLGNKFLLTVFNSLYGAQLTDLCYGFVAFRRDYLKDLSLSATGFEIEAEMIVSATKAGLRIAEVPSLELPRRSGSSNLNAIRDGIRVLRTVVRGREKVPAAHVVGSDKAAIDPSDGSDTARDRSNHASTSP